VTLLEQVGKYFHEYGSMALGALGLAMTARKLEYAYKNRRSKDRKEIYERLRALEITTSDQRSETKNIEKEFNKLREGCKLLETKADEAVTLSNRADKAVAIMMNVKS
jgi:hypothetical protein